MPVPYQNTYWVKEGSFLAGCYPGAPAGDLIPERLEALANAGVAVIISLLESGETYSDGSPCIPYDDEFLRLVNSRNVKGGYYSFPVIDFGLPDSRQMRDILNKIDAAMDRGQCVFVHCWGGKGRTGTVVGCWLARHGDIDPLETLQGLRKNCPNSNQPSPETQEQREFVLNWKKGI